MTKMTPELRQAIKESLVPRARRVAKKKGRRDRYSIWCRPYASDALGVHPEQVTEAREEMRKHGVDVDFDKSGRAIIKSDEHFKQVARAGGMYDGKDGYEVSGDDGFKRITGRGPVVERQRLRKLIQEWDGV